MEPSVTFPDPALVAQIAAIEAEQPRALVTFSWARSIAFALLFALAGGAIYAAVVAIMQLQLGIVSIVVGVLAGIGAAKGGRGRNAQIVGALAAAVGFFSGQFMAVAAIIGEKFFNIPVSAYGDMLWIVCKSSVNGMGVLFLGIAVYNGWRIPRAQS